MLRNIQTSGLTGWTDNYIFLKRAILRGYFMSVSELVVIGAGEHAAVLIDMLLARSDLWKIVAVISADPVKKGLEAYLPQGVRYIYSDSEALEFAASNPHCKFIAAIGSNIARRSVVEKMKVPEERWASFVHETAYVSKSAIIGAGSVLMPRAVVQPYAKVGHHCIINTAAVVEHDNLLEDYVHFAPSAVSGGGVLVKEGAFIGLASCVRDHVSVGSWSLVGAGSVVVSPVPDSVTVIGVPARKINRDKK